VRHLLRIQERFSCISHIKITLQVLIEKATRRISRRVIFQFGSGSEEAVLILNNKLVAYDKANFDRQKGRS